MAETIKGLEDLLKAFGAFGEEMDKSIEKAVKLTANEYKSDVQKLAPYKTGTYRRSIHVEMSGKVALVGTNLPQARILEYGGVIKPKNGKYLVFIIDGKKVFAKLVHRTAQPHFRPPLDKDIEKYKKIFKEALFG